MIKKIKRLVSNVVAMAKAKVVRSVLIISCLCTAGLALFAVPLNTSSGHNLLYSMVACCALSSALSLVAPSGCESSKQEDTTDEV